MIYFYNPFSNNKVEPGRCKNEEPLVALETLNDASMDAYNAHRVNLEFSKADKKFTEGAEWLSMYPGAKPMHHIWATDHIGKIHQFQTKETQFFTLPPEHDLSQMTMNGLRRGESHMVPSQPFRKAASDMNISMTVVSCESRVLQIPHFFSDVEVDHMLDVARQQNLHRSTTGSNGKDDGADIDTRTSTNTWVSRYSSPIIDIVYRREANVLKLDEALLRHRFPDEYPDLGTSEPISEELQLVYYDIGQQYAAHHDFVYLARRHLNSPSRCINVLMYLNEGMEGGETSFSR